MAIKNAIYKVDNGSSFDDIYFKTSGSQVVEDSTHRFTTDTEKSAWNGKASTALATTVANGLMSSGMVTKLDGIAVGANAYTHPSTHPATMITEDSTHRFTTDTEKAAWNGKASTALATTAANGLMSSGMVTKLNGIETGAKTYTHPATHPASMINCTDGKTIQYKFDTLEKQDNKISSISFPSYAKLSTDICKVLFKDEKDMVFINMQVEATSSNLSFAEGNRICTLPVGFRPKTNINVSAVARDSKGLGVVGLTININGDVVFSNTIGITNASIVNICSNIYVGDK